MSRVSHKIDRIDTIFDNPNLAPDAGLILAGTLMVRLGLEGLINSWVRTGSALPGRKVLTVVSAMLVGATHIDHVDILRAGATAGVLPHRVMAPSTIGTFLRSFTFGHVRQLDAVASRALARAWKLGAGPGCEPVVVDLDSTICEVHGKQKQGAAYGYTRKLGYHPLLATLAATSEIIMCRMRKGSANTARGVCRFIDELVAVLTKAGADTGSLIVRADSGFWSWKLVDRLDAHGARWSITVRNIGAIHAAISRIPERSWVAIGYTDSGEAQVASTAYTTGRGSKQRTVRLVVRRTRLTDPAQRALWPNWRYHSFVTNINTDVVSVDAFHRQHATVELDIRDLKEGTGAEHCPSGHYGANAAWLACAVLAHNIGNWTHQLGNCGDTPITGRTRRRRFFALCATLVNRSGRPTLRFPIDWPWAQEFTTALDTLRALPTAVFDTG